MTSTTIAENELWASLQAGNIERVTFLLQEKGELALYLNGNTVSTTEDLTASLDSASTIARLSVLEDVLPLALSSLAESYDKNGIVGDEGKYFALARELWKYLTDAEKSIPEMVCTFLYAGLKFDQPEFVRWILPIVSAHPAVDMSTLVSVRGYEFNQLRHSAIHYVARSGSIELFDMLVHACGGQSPLMLEAKWYESVTRDRLPVKVPTAQDTESGNTFSDTMLASSTSLPDLPDPPSLYVALKNKRLEFVRHVLGQLRPRDQAVVLRLTCVNGIMESDDAISAALLHSLCSQQSPDLATSTSASAAAAAASAASRENSKSASTISLVDTATLVDSVDISTALNEKVLKSSASGTHYPSTIIRQRSDTYNSGRWTHGARSSSALSSAGPSRRNSRTALVDPDVLLWAFGAGVGELPRFDAERESIDSSSSVTYSALHMCFFAVEDSAESSHMLPNPPGTRTEYARWALRVYGSFLLQPMSSMRWTGLGLGSSYAGSGSAAAAAQCTGWTALHSACAAGATDIVAAILVEDRSLLDSVAKKGISDAHITPAIVAVESTYWTQAFSCARTITGLLNSSQLEAQVYAPLRAAQVYSFRQAFAKALCQETGLSLRSIRQIQVVSAPAARTVTQTDSHSNNITDVEYDDIDSDESDGVEGSSFANSALDKKSASHRRSITLSRSRVQSSGSATNNDYMMRLRSRSDMSSTILDSAGSDGGGSEKGKEFATPERDADGTFQKVSYRQRDKQLSSNKRKSSSSQFQPPSPVIGATSPPRNGIQNVRELKNSSPTTSVAASTNVISTEKGLNTSTIHLPVMNSQNKKNNIIIPILPTSTGQKSHFEQTFTSNFVHSKANISLEQLEQEMEFVNSDSSYKNDNTRVQLQHFEHDYDFIDGMNLGLGISEEVSHTLTEPSLSVPVPTSAFTSTTSLPFHDEQLVLLSRMKQQLESLAQANANLEAQQRELLARDREREKRELEREAREKEREIQHQELLRLLKEKLSS
jgi:hypothetical protein